VSWGDLLWVLVVPILISIVAGPMSSEAFVIVVLALGFTTVHHRAVRRIDAMARLLERVTPTKA
jgi:hypothetical protein